MKINIEGFKEDVERLLSSFGPIIPLVNRADVTSAYLNAKTFIETELGNVDGIWPERWEINLRKFIKFIPRGYRDSVEVLIHLYLIRDEKCHLIFKKLPRIVQAYTMGYIDDAMLTSSHDGGFGLLEYELPKSGYLTRIDRQLEKLRRSLVKGDSVGEKISSVEQTKANLIDIINEYCRKNNDIWYKPNRDAMMHVFRSAYGNKHYVNPIRETNDKAFRDFMEITFDQDDDDDD